MGIVEELIEKKCNNCPHYQPHDISEEIICFSVFRIFYQFNQVLKKYQQQLKEELEMYKKKYRLISFF